MDTVDLQERHIAFVHDEMSRIECDESRHSSEQMQAEVVREATERLLCE